MKEIGGLIFDLTCARCPEQYDVRTKGGRLVGYARLRWGELTCKSPDVNGEVIYSADIGDGEWTGEFETDEQRTYHLTAIARAIKQRMDELCPGEECRFYANKNRITCQYCTRYRFDCFTKNKTDSCDTCKWYDEYGEKCKNEASSFTRASLAPNFCCDLWEKR